MQRPARGLTVVAWILIASHAIGVVANLVSLALGDPRYSPTLWAVFASLKALGLAGGVLLLLRKRAGLWCFAASLALGIVVAIGFTGPYPATYWLGAGAALTVVVLGTFVAIRRDLLALRSSQVRP